MITATVTPRGKKFYYEVYEDGKLKDTRTSAHRYEYIRVQRWESARDPQNWAARYSRTPGKIGSKIEYGYCAENVKIEDKCSPADVGWDKPSGYCTDHGAYDPAGDCPGCVEEATQRGPSKDDVEKAIDQLQKEMSHPAFTEALTKVLEMPICDCTNEELERHGGCRCGKR